MVAWAGAVAWVCHGSAAFQIAVSPRDESTLDIQFETQPDTYYVVYLSPTADQRGTPVAIWYTPEPVATDPAMDFGVCCVRQIPKDAPADTDQDGMDDVFELDTVVLDPLHDGDATLDPDGDGMDTLHEYQLGRDPFSAPVPDAAGILNLDLFTPLDPA